jgi:hypothetical protein
MVRNLKLAVRWLLERTTVGYLALLRHDEVARKFEQVARLNLPGMGDPPKNWDSLAAVDCSLEATTQKAQILDGAWGEP